MDFDDQASLNALLARFEGYFGNKKVVPDEAKIVWLGVWAKLTKEQRKAAEKLVYYHCQFYPTPETFENYAFGGDPQEKATEQWVIILSLLHLAPCDAAPAINQQLDAIGVQALRNIGGLSHIGSQPEHALFNSQNLFVTAYKKIFRESGNNKPSQSLAVERAVTQVKGFSSLKELVHVHGNEHDYSIAQ